MEARAEVWEVDWVPFLVERAGGEVAPAATVAASVKNCTAWGNPGSPCPEDKRRKSLCALPGRRTDQRHRPHLRTTGNARV